MDYAYLALHGEPVATVGERAAGCRYIVAPFNALRSDTVAWWEIAKSTGARLMAHVPVSYFRAEYVGDFYDRWKEMYRQGGALKDADGKAVVVEGMHILDLRSTGSMRDWCIYYATSLAHHAARLLNEMPTLADGSSPIAGFFLDMAVDSITWTGAPFANPGATNDAWRKGTDRFIRLVGERAESTGRLLLVGNGNCQSGGLDAICYEAWPQQAGPGWTGYIDGAYGTRWHWRAHTTSDPWLIPLGESPGGHGVSLDLAYQARGFMAAFAYDGVLCVNDPATRAMLDGAAVGA